MDASSEASRANLYCHREAAAWAPKPRELPVTLVTGFLGSGKTSLLRHILTNKSNLRVAAAVNDFAAVNLDAKLVSKVQQIGGGARADTVVELSNGCLCCSSAASSGFSEAVWKVLQECDVGKVQYLVVETSGVTDPLSLIGTLDQEFGRLFRVRLDSVVTVVDADVLLAELASADLAAAAGGAAPAAVAGPPRQYIASRTAGGDTSFASSVAESQLRCADAVLLNKVDLLPEAEQRDAAVGTLAEWVEREVGAGVRVYPCSQCSVPLDAIMEVTQSNLYDESMKGVHTHERTESNYVVLDAQYGTRRVGSLGGGPAPAAGAAAATAPGSFGLRLPTATDYAVRCYESPGCVSLAGFQDFVADAFVRCRLMRLKGNVSFHEGGSFFFHASGRQRFELTDDLAGGGSGGGGVQMVLIGVGEQAVDDAHDQLASAAVEAAADAGAAQRAEVEAPIRSHDMFSVRDGVASEAAECGGCVVFRLTGTERSGLSVQEMREQWHVDPDRLNAQLLAAVNSDAGPAFLTPVRLQPQTNDAVVQQRGGRAAKGELWLRHALGGQMSMLSWWGSTVMREAEAIVGRSSAMQAALGAGVACPKGEASIHMMENKR